MIGIIIFIIFLLRYFYLNSFVSNSIELKGNIKELPNDGPLGRFIIKYSLDSNVFESVKILSHRDVDALKLKEKFEINLLVHIKNKKRFIIKDKYI